MAHIIEFSITGLAGRDEVYAQKLNRDVNVFYGLNGSGKTSLLKILHSAMSDDASFLMNVPFRRAELKLYSVKFDRVYSYTIEQTLTKKEPSEETTTVTYGLLGGLETIKGRISPDLSWKVQPQSDRSHWQHRYLPTSRLYLGDAFSTRSIYSTEDPSLSEERLDLYFGQFLERLWATYSAQVLSLVRKAQEDGLAEILKALLTTKKSRQKRQEIESDIAYKRAATFLGRQGSAGVLGTVADFKERYKDNPQIRSVIGQINKIEGRIEEVMGPRNKLQTLIEDMFSGNKKVSFGDSGIEVRSKPDIKISLASLSSGEKHLLRMFIETLIVEQSSLLIDEPEISLHVDWQKCLIKTMQQLNPMAQLILATHSPEIMADVDDSKIFRI